MSNIKIAEELNVVVESAVRGFDGDYRLGSPFEELISFGEIVDRLSIVNCKLARLKDEVMRRDEVTKWVHESEKMEAERFRAWASVEDVKLCKERSRLKSCVDQKLAAMIVRVTSGDVTAGHNSETKLYGNKV